jgi:hypothetical protein
LVLFEEFQKLNSARTKHSISRVAHGDIECIFDHCVTISKAGP